MGWLLPFCCLLISGSYALIRKSNDSMMDSLTHNHEWALLFEYETISPEAKRQLQPTAVSFVVHQTKTRLVEQTLLFFPCRTCNWAVKGRTRTNSRDHAFTYDFFDKIVEGKLDISIAFTIYPTVKGFDTDAFPFHPKVMRPQEGVLDGSFYHTEPLQFKEIRLNMYFENQNETLTIFDWKKEVNFENPDPNFTISHPGIYLFQTKKDVPSVKPLFYNPSANMHLT